MTARPAPITKAKHGSTRCVGCSKLFAATPGVPVTVVEADEQGWGRVDSAGQFRRNLSLTRVGRRWHTACLAAEHERNEAYRAQAAADNLRTIRQMLPCSTCGANPGAPCVATAPGEPAPDEPHRSRRLRAARIIAANARRAAAEDGA